ncbi:hypothetical protein CSUB01_12148 [Colletotrichum sublineola]|uniref:Uncharacterized protein n=1 Tax=Colletotrichum sublineola TaxID=1173701 RepID=A0A066X7B1_COLSU|nr:hypothetical protein CSUB01_12148 [Colletotrichum sublineola]
MSGREPRLGHPCGRGEKCSIAESTGLAQHGSTPSAPHAFYYLALWMDDLPRRESHVRPVFNLGIEPPASNSGGMAITHARRRCLWARPDARRRNCRMKGKGERAGRVFAEATGAMLVDSNPPEPFRHYAVTHWISVANRFSKATNPGRISPHKIPAKDRSPDEGPSIGLSFKQRSISIIAQPRNRHVRLAGAG